MPNGITTQAIALLFSCAPNLDQLRQKLAPYTPKVYRNIPSTWPGKNATLSFWIPDLPDTFVAVDIINEPWPDALTDDYHPSDLFISWKLGHFGPATEPASLSSALTRNFLWPQESQAVSQHKSFIRLRTVSTAPDAPLISSPIKTPAVACQHLAHLDSLAIQLLDLPGALAYFNPAGANILSKGDLIHFTKQSQELGFANNLVWTNRFFYTINDQWFFFETRGNRQFHLPDLELPLSSIHHQHARPCNTFLANVTLKLINDPNSIVPGTLLPGPTDLNYKAHFLPTSLAPPDRPVILLLPEGMDQLPPEFPKRPGA